MLLQKLLEGIPYKMLQGTNEVEIKMPVYDSRKVQPGDLFVCITGFQTDGHRYIPMALEKGAAALLVEHAVEDITGKHHGDSDRKQPSGIGGAVCKFL